MCACSLRDIRPKLQVWCWSIRAILTNKSQLSCYLQSTGLPCSLESCCALPSPFWGASGSFASRCGMNRSSYLLHSRHKEALRFAPCGGSGWRHLRRIWPKVALRQRMVQFLPTEGAEIRKSIRPLEVQEIWETGRWSYSLQESIGSRMIRQLHRRSQSFTKF